MGFGRLMRAIAWAAVLATFACTVAWTLHAIPLRLPAWCEVEVWFEADRLRAGLPLYVDPNVGADDYGPIPARWFVTYPPVVSHLARFLPVASRAVVLRSLASLAFAFALAWPALRGSRLTGAATRREAVFFAIYFASFWILANLATTGRPDSFALALASVAYTRTLNEGELDNGSSALFALAAIVKPTVVGLAVCALAVTVWRHKARALRRVWGGALVALVVGGALVLESRGALLANVAAANGQPLVPEQWIANLPRLVFFAPPCGIVAWAARQTRSPRGQLACAGICGSFLLTFLALGKIGSASNYWLEPAVATVAAIAHFGSGIVWEKTWPAALALVQVFYVEIAASRSALERIVADNREARLVRFAREACRPSESRVVMSDNAGVEYMLNARIVTTAFQLVHAANRGRVKNTIWADHLSDPRVVCFIAETDIVASTPGANDVLSREFVQKDEAGSFRLMLRKKPAPPLELDPQ